MAARRPGVGTFVTRTPADASLAAHGPLQKDLRRWLTKTRLAGLDEESIEALFLVGPNGAGTSTLLKLASGMPTPTAGTIEVCGGRPAEGVKQLAEVGFVAQDTPPYAALSIADHLELGRRLNPNWDDALARDRQTILLVRTDATLHDPSWTVTPLGPEDIVLACMTRPADAVRDTQPAREVLR